MAYDINQWIFEIPLEDIQEFDGNVKGDNPCICCGKQIINQRYCVHVVNGVLVSTEEPFADGEDMGFYPIGTNCKNKLPNNFYWKV